MEPGTQLPVHQWCFHYRLGPLASLSDEHVKFAQSCQCLSVTVITEDLCDTGEILLHLTSWKCLKALALVKGFLE